jgi:hypothetical protein
LPDGTATAAAAALVARKPNDDGGKVLALSSFGDALGPYDFHAALFGPSRRATFPWSGPVRMAVADPIDACDVKAFKAPCWRRLLCRSYAHTPSSVPFLILCRYPTSEYLITLPSFLSSSSARRACTEA